MTRRVSKNGRAYTEGSRVTRGAFPRACHGCGRPTRLHECWQETLEPSGEKRSWHHSCRLAASGEWFDPAILEHID